MLISFNNFWLFAVTLFGTWAFYGLFGFDFTIVTVLAIGLFSSFTNNV